MLRTSLVIAAVVGLSVACTDEQEPTAPQGAGSAALSPSDLSRSSLQQGSSGVSSICLVNQKALANIDGQLQDNPGNAELEEQLEAQKAITADVCE